MEVNGTLIGPGNGGIGKPTDGNGALRLAYGLFLTTQRNFVKYVRFVDDFPANPLNNVWADVGTGPLEEDKTYVVQTDTKIIHRCTLMTTDPATLCRTRPVVRAPLLWSPSNGDAGGSLSTLHGLRLPWPTAGHGRAFPYYSTCRFGGRRCQRESELAGNLFRPQKLRMISAMGSSTSVSQHVTLKSIANNPDIVGGIGSEE